MSGLAEGTLRIMGSVRMGEWFCGVGMMRGIANNQRISYPTIFFDQIA
jgi:hypothetical protein